MEHTESKPIERRGIRIFFGTVLPAMLSLSVGFGMFFHFLYPSLAAVAAQLEIGHIKPVYSPGEKIVIPAELVNTTERTLTYLVDSNIRSAVNKASLEQKRYVLPGGARQKFNFNYDIPSDSEKGDFSLSVLVRAEKQSGVSTSLAGAQRYFEVAVSKPAEPEALKQASKEPAEQLLGIIRSASISGTADYGAVPAIELVIQNKSRRSGEFTIIAEIKNPAGAKEQISRNLIIAANKEKKVRFPYHITDDKPEGGYSVRVYFIAERSQAPSASKTVYFNVVDRPPAVKYKSLVLSGGGEFGLDFNADVSDDRAVREVYFIYKPAGSPEPRYFAMDLTSGNRHSGIWTFHIDEHPRSKKIAFSLLAIDSKGQELKTLDQAIELPLK